MSNGSDVPSSFVSPAEHLSALVDGEIDASAVSKACAAWRDEDAHRADWHAFHLIGDVLRSEDLASTASHDASFLAAIRVRMAAEPIVLAPTPSVEADETKVARVAGAAVVEQRRRVGASGNSRWSWKAPSAVAAGFVVVAGALMVTRGPTQDATLASATPTTRVASLPEAASPNVRVAATTSFAPPAVANTPNFQLIRDARLDRYLSAHKEFAGSTALGVPSGFLRDAVAESPSR